MVSKATDIVVSQQDARQLRDESYNAAVVRVIPVHEDLRILRVRPDWGSTEFSPGQYSVLGLGGWEPRVEGVQEEGLADGQLRKLFKRAYSFSCPMLGRDGELLPPRKCEFLEFYIVLIRQGETKPPGLTPRLFALDKGDRLFVGPKVTGHYTLEGVKPTDDVVFVATGTGEAPHNAMIAELLSIGHQGRLASVICVRNKRDLGYAETYRELESRFANVAYLPLTTREPENLDPAVSGYVGKRYVQDLFETGDFERETGVALNPARTHVFLCGNPAMIGAPLRGASVNGRFPKPKGMVEVLENMGFKADEPHSPGNIHFEKYW